jgi:nitroreductase
MHTKTDAKNDIPAADAPGGVMDTISRRFSCRSYKPDAVPEESLLRILEAARLAPSACNGQPWRFAVVRDPETRRRVVEEGFLPGIGMKWALEAPVHVIVGMARAVSVSRVGSGVSGIRYPWIDIGIAGEHLVLAAAAAGLGSCWIGWIRERALSKIAGWSGSVKAVAVITVGYPKAENERLSSERRKELSEIVTWA